MEVVEGTIGQIARAKLGSARSRKTATVSVIEVGHHYLRQVVLTEPLSQALESGKFARVLVWHDLTDGMTHPIVAAVQVDGKTYRSSQVVPMGLLRILFWMMLVVAIGFVFPPLGVFVAACIIGYYAKNYLDYLQFGSRAANQP